MRIWWCKICTDWMHGWSCRAAFMLTAIFVLCLALKSHFYTLVGRWSSKSWLEPSYPLSISISVDQFVHNWVDCCFIRGHSHGEDASCRWRVDFVRLPLTSLHSNQCHSDKSRADTCFSHLHRLFVSFHPWEKFCCNPSAFPRFGWKADEITRPFYSDFYNGWNGG